jgi:hypothetical protein
VVYIFSNTGAFLTTALYCLWLHTRHRTLGDGGSIQHDDLLREPPFTISLFQRLGNAFYFRQMLMS